MTSSSVGIRAWGAYIPQLRLEREAIAAAHAWLAPGLKARAKGARAMASWDEDALTMAVEAARDALGPGEDRTLVQRLWFASSTAPFADRLNAGVVAGALTLRRDLSAVDVGGSQRAGLAALAHALAAERSAARGVGLVCMGEHRRARAASPQEMDFGDGAAAFVIDRDDLSAELLGHGAVTDDFVDHFRADVDFDYAWEERWVRDEGQLKLIPEAVDQALKAAGVSPAEVTRFCLPSTFAGVPEQVAKRLGVAVQAVRPSLGAEMGEAGAAHGGLMLAHALEDAAPGEVIVAAQFGQGADALVFRATGRIGSSRPQRGLTGSLAQGRPETNYFKYLVYNDLLDWERGMRGERDNKTALTALYRSRDAILGLVGGRCRETGVVQFPRSRISVAPNAHGVDTQDPYKFSERRGRILSWSADHLGFSISPPNHYAMVEFEGGGRISLDLTDVAQGEVSTGMEVIPMFRIKEFDSQRGFRRYFWKAVPLSPQPAHAHVREEA